MGLETPQERSSLYLTIAGGYIWNRRATQDDPNYVEETYTNYEGEEKKRVGARYQAITGKITNVVIRTHEKYGESINVSIQDGDDDFILSMSTNNNNSQSMMKALLLMDLDEEVYIRPYDFEDDGKTRRGISFKQNGQKLDLKKVEISSDFDRDDKFWKDKSASGKKKIKRYYEDLNDWFVAEVEEKVCSVLNAKQGDESPKQSRKKEKVVTTTRPSVEGEADYEKVAKESRPSPIKMKRAIKAYINENYEGTEMPELSKEQVIEWYDLVQEGEELPLGGAGKSDDQDDIDADLQALMAED